MLNKLDVSRTVFPGGGGGGYITQPKSTMFDSLPKTQGPTGIIHFMAGYIAAICYIMQCNSRKRSQSS